MDDDVIGDISETLDQAEQAGHDAHGQALAVAAALELSDREKAQGLRNLLEVELQTARVEHQRQRPETSYVDGRIASYELVIQAIDRRWPDLERITI